MHMVPAIRNILGGFLFSGDDVYKKVRVLSGGERTRLAVARMLLRPSNTLLLDEPTNHLDLDSKEVLLDALVDYGGTLIFVSHDRYFVERLATKIIEVGSGDARSSTRAPTRSSCGTRSIRRTAQRRQDAQDCRKGRAAPDGRPRPHGPGQPAAPKQAGGPHAAGRAGRSQPTHEDKKRADAEARKQQRAAEARQRRDRRARGADRRVRSRDQASSSRRWRRPGFYDDRAGRPAGHRPAPGADVEGRRPDAPVGRTSSPRSDLAPEPLTESSSALQFCYNASSCASP